MSQDMIDQIARVGRRIEQTHRSQPVYSESADRHIRASTVAVEKKDWIAYATSSNLSLCTLPGICSCAGELHDSR